ncbi:helix-turn-helix domain-containing protein [Weissella soli]|uniref:helix-turn-helix domain-containing protein n=1 Tax=Weissella soli TaxID=155866 RepID=UPI003C741F2F
MNLVERIKMIAHKRSMTIKDLSIKAGIGPKTISNWRDRNPQTETLQKVADVLGVSVDYLLGNTDDMHSATNADEPVDLDNDTTILSLDGMELSDDYKKFIVDQVRALRKMRGDN